MRIYGYILLIIIEYFVLNVNVLEVPKKKFVKRKDSSDF